LEETRLPISISAFLGINEQGNTQLKQGEAEVMTNFRLVDEYKPRVIEGYVQDFASIGASNIQGMWRGKLGGVDRFLFAHGGHIYRDLSISGTTYDALDTSTYTNVDVVKTTALSGAEAGSTGVDNVVILKNSAGTRLTEVAAASVDNVASVGKFYFDSDEKISFIVAKGTYATIASARTALGTSTGYYRIGTLTNAKTNFFYFDGAIYIQNGAEYKKWTGSGAIATVTGYVPLIATATPPTGGGTSYEALNTLTGEKRQWFSGNGSATQFFIAETGVASIDYVKNLVTGTNYTLTTDYTVDTTAGKVTFNSPPANVANNVEIKWTKGSGSRSYIEGCRDTLIYNGENDTRVFMWGNATYKNRRYHSALADVTGTLPVPSAEYFPTTNYYDIGTSEFSITDIIKQYDRQIIYTDGGKAFYSYYNLFTFDDGSTTISFPVFPLNDAVGNVAFGQAQLIENNPITIYKGVYQWISTNVRDERNAAYISRRVQPSLDDVVLENAITFDYESKKEYWLCVGKTIWVYNYRLDAWYKFTLLSTPTCFVDYDGFLWFGTDNGEIMKFDEDLRSFNGSDIAAEIYLGFMDMGIPNRVKYLEESHISLKAESRVSLDVYWETNKKLPKTTAKTIGYTNLDFDDIDFDDFSFSGNYNPQPFKVKTKAKNWVYFRYILKLTSDTYTAQILDITAEPTLGGYSK
jgi:hypothetical protein